jgi:dTDP-4-dehydrorhamnose 3,5-epimerase
VDGVILTPLKKISHPKGDIWHAMKKSDNGYCGFGEAYFSTIKKDLIKGWKRHSVMTLNLVVPIGSIQVVVFNAQTKKHCSHTLHLENYKRLTIAPGLWVAFKGLSENSILLNLANIEHDPNESQAKNISEIEYLW